MTEPKKPINFFRILPSSHFVHGRWRLLPSRRCRRRRSRQESGRRIHRFDLPRSHAGINRDDRSDPAGFPIRSVMTFCHGSLLSCPTPPQYWPSKLSHCRPNSTGRSPCKSGLRSPPVVLSVKPSALICGSETWRMASQHGALSAISEATNPRTASPISETSPSPCSLKWLFDVSKPKKSVVTTDDRSAFSATRTIFGGRKLSFGSCAAFGHAAHCPARGLRPSECSKRAIRRSSPSGASAMRFFPMPGAKS